MKVIEEIRLENLRILVDEAGGIAKFAERAGKQPAQISQLLNRSPDSKTKKPKAIGSSQAREFENAGEKEIGWMDHDHSDHEANVFKRFPPEVRAWLIKRGDQGTEQGDPPAASPGRQSNG